MRHADTFCKYTEDATHYIYTGTCILSGKEVTVKIPKPELYDYRKGGLIQEAMPSLSAGEREFLMSGISGEAFDEAFRRKKATDA